MSSLRKTIQKFLPEITDIRRHIHQHPELGYQEQETARLVIERLTAQGGFEISTQIAQTGIVATLGKDKPGQGVALRADMDCLPIEETSGKEWSSCKPGLMHACGHDGHTACLLGTALTLSEFADDLRGPVKFIFQPAEEGGAGGKAMVEAGVLENPRVEILFGLHGWPSLKLGQFSTCAGPMMANSDEFEITIHGRGGHAAFPHLCIDPIVVASHIITALQTLCSRRVAPNDAAVVTVAKIEGGSAFNIIPDSVDLLGTARTLSATTQAEIFDHIRSTAEGIAKSMGARAEVTLKRGYPVVINHPETTDYLKTTLTGMEAPLQHIEGVFPQMGGEDFAYFAEARPACFFALGLNPDENSTYPQLHQSDYDFNDDALPLGMRCFSELVLNYWT